MKRNILCFVLLFISIISYAQLESLESATSTTYGINKTYSVECNEGSQFSCTLFASISATSSGKQPIFSVYLNGDLVSNYCANLGENTFSATLKIKESGKNEIRIYFDRGTASLRKATVTDVTLNKSISDGNNMFYLINNENTLKLVSMSKSHNNVVAIPSSVSIPFVGVYDVAELDDTVFINNNKIEFVTLPATLKKIGNKCFYGCDSLKKIHSLATQSPLPGENAFPENTEIHVYPNSVWYDAQNWSSCHIIYDLHEDPYNIDDDWESYSFIPPVESKKVSFTRGFADTQWQPLYLPFSMQYTTLSKKFEVARLNNIHQYDENEDGIVDCTELEIIKIKEGTILPNTPYMIRALEEGSKYVSESNFTMEASTSNRMECSSFSNNYAVIGCYETRNATEMENGSYIVNDGQLVLSSESNTNLGCFRWYMKATEKDGSAVKFNAIRIRVKGETDDVSSVIYDASGTGIRYDILGRKVGLSPRGLYIKNGKTYLSK